MKLEEGSWLPVAQETQGSPSMHSGASQKDKFTSFQQQNHHRPALLFVPVVRICLLGKQHQPSGAQFRLELLWSSPQSSEFPTVSLIQKPVLRHLQGWEPSLRNSLESIAKFPLR